MMNEFPSAFIQAIRKIGGYGSDVQASIQHGWRILMAPEYLSCWEAAGVSAS